VACNDDVRVFIDGQLPDGAAVAWSAWFADTPAVLKLSAQLSHLQDATHTEQKADGKKYNCKAGVAGSNFYPCAKALRKDSYAAQNRENPVARLWRDTSNA
jgi:hypothetical protein